ADASFHEYEGTGSFYTSFSCEPGRAPKNLAGVEGGLRQGQAGGITGGGLQQAQSKVRARVGRGDEPPIGRKQGLGMGWNYPHEYRTVDDELKAFEAVNLKKIRKVLDRYPLDQATTLALGPLEKLRRPRGNGAK